MKELLLLPLDARLLRAIAEASIFAATVPLPGGGASFRFVRAALTIVLVPVLVSGFSRSSVQALDAAVSGAVIGAAFGMSATIALCAAGAAGSIVGAALQWSPLDREALPGPIGFLYQLGFATVLFASGGFERMVLTLARADAALPASLFTIGGMAGLASMATRDCLLIASPALFAQVLATLVAGLAARAAPQVGGLLMTSPLVSAAVGVGLLASAGSVFERFGWIAQHAVQRLTLH